MKKRFLWALVISVLLFSFSAFANDEEFVGGIGMLDESEVLATSIDASINIDEEEVSSTILKKLEDPAVFFDGEKLNNKQIENFEIIQVMPELSEDLKLEEKKNIEHPELPHYPITPHTGKGSIPSKSEESARSSSSIGVLSSGNDNPNSALFFPVNASYQDTISYQGEQAWFATQAPANGQMTVHLTVPKLSNIDYDLYVCNYDNGSISIAYASERVAGADEHISFMATGGSYYFFFVNAYTGSSTTPYRIHLDHTTTYDVYEINDFYNQAKPLTNGATTTGAISTPTDEDFYKVTITGNTTVLTVRTANTGMQALLYNEQLTGGYVLETSCPNIGQGSVYNTYTHSSLMPGTYYLHMSSTVKTGSSVGVGQYEISLNNFNTPGNGDLANIMGYTRDGLRMAYYIRWTGALAVNNSIVNPGPWNWTFTKYQERFENQQYWGLTTTFTSYSGGYATDNYAPENKHPFFASYSSTLGINCPDALIIFPSQARFTNDIKWRAASSYEWTNTYSENYTWHDDGENGDLFVVIDLNTGQAVDAPHYEFNLQYGRFFGDMYQYSYTRK